MDRPYRLLIAVHICFGRAPGGGPTSSYGVTVHLDSEGRNVRKGGLRPRPPKERIVDLRVGDQVLFDDQWLTVHRIAAFSEQWLTEESAQKTRSEGYLYRPKDRTADDVPVIWCNDK